MKEHPILFSTPMVQAILNGNKTMTRRVIKPQPKEDYIYCHGICTSSTDNTNVGRVGFGPSEFLVKQFVKCPYGQPGDRLWVRETFCYDDVDNGGQTTYYRADYTDRQAKELFNDCDLPWKPSIHMPRAAARILLEVVSVRVERLQDITYDDCLREGMWNYGTDVDALAAFQELWQNLNAKRGYGWNENPWVWVVEFRRVDA